MLTYQVGDVEIAWVPDDDFALPSDAAVPSWAVPHLAPDGSATYLAFSAFGLRSEDQCIVVDPWLANDSPRSQPHAASRIEGLLGQLAEADIAADDVDTVVNSHIDGVGWNTRPSGAVDDSNPDSTDSDWVPTFGRARYLFPRAEIEAYDRGDPLFDGADLSPLIERDLIDTVLPGPPVTLTREVSVVSAPGHNFGHLAVRIDSDSELAVIAGHLFLNVFEIDEPAQEADDGPQAARTRRAILEELADRRGLLLAPLLGGSGGGRVERSGDRFTLADPR